MDWVRIESDWRQFKGGFKRHWPRLTNIDVITGRREWLVRNIRDRYCIPQHEAEKQLADWQGCQSRLEKVT